ncbi:MAG: inorganic diphosphatase [Candidatus Staskawiczbacteria bacterium]|nr:inorganic diphosphatase [Candidatus Staskawiczbacteria bacterium]
MSYENIQFGTPEKFNVVVEIQKGGQVKYEYDEEWHEIKVSAIFKNGFGFPFDYGFIPETRGGDGDHLDVFVLGSQSVQMGMIVECRPIGMIELIDRGEKDDKILAIPLNDLGSENIKTLEDLPFDYKKIFEEFFKELAVQRKKIMEIKGYKDVETAIKELELANKNFK